MLLLPIPLLYAQVQRQASEEIRISKTDTLLTIAHKIIASTGLSIIIDGTASSAPLDIEGSYSLQVLLEQIKTTADYSSVLKGNILLFYKKFTQEKTRPDYSLPEVIFGLREIKTIAAPLVYKREHPIAITRIFEEAVANMTPLERAQAQSGGIVVGNTNPAARQVLLRAIDYHALSPLYFAISRILPILENLEKSSISSSQERRTLFIYPENSEDSHRFPLFSTKNINDKAQPHPVPGTSLTQYLAATSSTDRVKIPESLKDYKVTFLPESKDFDAGKLKLLAELNQWTFTAGSISAPNNQADLPPIGKLIHLLPGNVVRMMTLPLVPEPSLDDIRKLLHDRDARLSVTNRMRVFSDESLLRISEFFKKQPPKSEIPYKDLPLDIKEAVLDAILMHTLVALYDDIIRNSLRPNSYIVHPDKALFVKSIPRAGDSPSYTIQGPTGGKFSVRSARPPDP